MEFITESLGGAILRSVPRLDLSPIGGKSHGKLKLSPEQLLSVIHARALALWALTDQFAIYPTTLETWTGRASSDLCRQQHFADGSGADGLAEIV